MTGNTREFDAVVTAARADGSIRVACSDEIASPTPFNTITFMEERIWGDSFDVPLADDLSDAGGLVGRRVRVTVEVLDA